jgi:glycosyltransferase involved in cell wall biosynthesis
MKTCYILYKKSTFGLKDYQIISRFSDCKLVNFNYTTKPLFPIKTLIYIFKIIASLPFNNIYITQHIGYHTFFVSILTTIFKKKLILLAGGSDCFSYNIINYGNFNKSILAICTKYACQKAHTIILKHISMYKFIDTYNFKDGQTKGLSQHVKNLDHKIKVIENGYDHKYFYCNSSKESNTFVTVANNLGKENNVIHLKGIDLIIESAKSLENCTFIIIGGKLNKSNSEIPKNIKVIEQIDQESLRQYYSTSSFYLQLSVSEGFPNSLCEAMLCECIPIVSNITSMPEIIQNNGLILKKRNALDLINLIQKGLIIQNKNELRYQIRNSIIERFNLDNRIEKLKQVIN